MTLSRKLLNQMKCIAFYEINVNFEIDVTNHVFDGEMDKID